ncbi:uncharacterized protein LOC131226031 [Magnolia sinica]|uniref:uncharacterized protein LOC131226031 n=1 Tax=Magnolia sinica TaxID=86752 RepID=UPI00265A6DD4|nr:uncharacterized protein LOC131226031 [Magnolia sinica]
MLVKLALTTKGRIPRFVPVEFLSKPSINDHAPEVVQPMQTIPSWMDPIFEFLRNGKVSEDRLEAQRLRIRSARYVIIGDILYKKGFSQPYLRCLRLDEAKYVIKEIHERICGNHSVGRALAQKIICQGYFWPTIQVDSRDFTRKCDKCQRFTTVPRQLVEELTPMSGP